MAKIQKYNSTEKALIKEVSKGRKLVFLAGLMTFITMCASLIVTSYAIFSGRITVDYDNFGEGGFAFVLTYGLLFGFTILGVVLSFMLFKAMLIGKPFSQLFFYVFQIFYFFYFMIYALNYYANDNAKFLAIFYLIFFIIIIANMFIMKGKEQSKYFENMKIVYNRRKDRFEEFEKANQVEDDEEVQEK